MEDFGPRLLESSLAMRRGFAEHACLACWAGCYDITKHKQEAAREMQRAYSLREQDLFYIHATLPMAITMTGSCCKVWKGIYAAVRVGFQRVIAGTQDSRRGTSEAIE